MKTILRTQYLHGPIYFMLFNIKGKNLVLAAIGGMLGATMYRLAQQLGCGEMASMLLGSVSLSLYAEILARVCHTPVTTFLVCALIPHVSYHASRNPRACIGSINDWRGNNGNRRYSSFRHFNGINIDEGYFSPKESE